MAGAMPTAIATVPDHEVIKIEDNPEPVPHTLTLTNSNTMVQPLDPKDPEGFLRRCSGYNKKKGVRCSASIGRNSHHTKNSHATFLPTCYAHKDQQSYAGWCQFMQRDGERCGKLFRWTPPYFELCAEHQGHPDTPCYFMKLPLELRLEVFRYLLPSRAIASSTSLLHIDEDPDQQQCPWYHSTAPPRPGSSNLGRVAHAHGSFSPLDRSTMRSVFPIPFMDLLLTNRQIHNEAKDLLYSTVPFTIDVRKDGTFMCGRRLLEPRRADGSSHYVVGDVDKIKERFLATFDWAAVKNYNVDILVENWKDDTNRGYHTFPWDEEVEIYDIRDYIGVVVSGILSKARNLCRLNVRLGFSKFIWTEEELHTNIRTLVGPFERLRNVRQPRLLGVYEGTPQTNFMISLPVPSQAANFNGPAQVRPSTPLCSVPQLLTKVPLLICDQSDFIEYRSDWERRISSASTTSLVAKPPIRAMFTELKEFYTRLAAAVPDVTARNGRHAFLHRARVAREQENVEAFRHLRNELIGYWEAYIEQEERKKDDMNRRLSRMLDVDVYPSSWDEDHACIAESSSSGVRSRPNTNSQPLITTDAQSWHSAAMYSCQEKPHSPHTQQESFDKHRSHVPASSSKREVGSSAQSPIVIDLAGENGIREMQRIDKIRHETTIQYMPSQQRGHMSLQSPTGSEDQTPFSSPKTTLQASTDQQPMALNPQPHLEAAMSHRRQVELQAHRARAMQEMARRHAMHRNQIAQVESQRSYSVFSPTVSHPEIVAMPPIPVQQLQSQFRDAAAHVHASASSSPSSSFSSMIQLSTATMGMPMANACPQQPSLPSDVRYADYPFKQYITIPNAEPAVHVYEASSNKRPVSETEEMEMTDGKRQRVDSGMGWGDEDHERQREASEDSDKDMINHDGTEKYDHIYDQRNISWGHGWGPGQQEEISGKGKGKARAEEREVVWVE